MKQQLHNSRELCCKGTEIFANQRHSQSQLGRKAVRIICLHERKEIKSYFILQGGVSLVGWFVVVANKVK